MTDQFKIETWATVAVISLCLGIIIGYGLKTLEVRYNRRYEVHQN